MKFDFCIGNPPYQADVEKDGDRANPVYDKFMDAAYDVADCVELIHPARFLFNAGQTPKAWNEKMLADEHFSVLDYESDATKVFPNTDIKGGVAISIRNRNREYGPIGTFTSFNELNSIIRTVSRQNDFVSLRTIIASQGLFRFTSLFFQENPEASSLMGKGTGNKIVSSIMDKMPNVFQEKQKDRNDIRFLGRIQNKRAYRWIKRKYIEENDYIDKYKLFIPEANNAGKFGETLTEPTLGIPGDGSADTFLSAGMFDSDYEAINFQKYIKTKFFRALLGVKKVTQHCPPAVWELIPLQDFSSVSDIDWSKSISIIDQQLYAKYGLLDAEVAFIESHVKEME